MTWTKARINELLRLHRRGLSQRLIAEEMGLKKDQVEAKCHRMGLTKENPGKPNKALIKQRYENRRNREASPRFKFEKADPKIRKCLGECGQPFHSEWAGERVCKRCKSTEAWRRGEMRLAAQDSKRNGRSSVRF